ncbi:hypothetical protein [Pectobacterium carotovorum]|uniref:hypothetical protein n=1 Tax=Pectobacterium carotovorum TaxID=554 RepID=UPI003019AB60
MTLIMSRGIYLPRRVESVPGENGHSPMMTVADDAIQWKLDNETVWNILLPLSDIDGQDGRSLEMQVSGGFIQTRLIGDVSWNNLIAMPTSGTNGNTILNGTTDPTSGIGANGDFYINRTALTIAGPKSSGSWPAGVSLKGADGQNATTTANATTSTNGLMSSTDKTKLDGIQAQSATVVVSGGRPIGTAFTVHASRNARVTYSIGYALSATLAVGQTVQIVATVDGSEVARISDAVLLGLAGTLNKNESISFFVPAGKQVLLTKSGTAAVVVTVASGQETLL